MLFGYGVALLVLAALFVCAAAFGGQIKPQLPEEMVEVKLVKQAEPPKPPPPAPKPIAPRTERRAAAAALGNREAPPKEVPKDLPKEGDVSKAVEATEHHDGYGDPNGVKGGKGTGTVAAAPSAATTAPEPPPPPVTQAAQVVTPPAPISKVMPAYPDEARKQGIESIVEATFFVNLNGDVEDIQIVRGDAIFRAPVIAALQKWRFTPGAIDGVPTRLRRRVKFPFHLRTQ